MVENPLYNSSIALDGSEQISPEELSDRRFKLALETDEHEVIQARELHEAR